MITTTYTCDRCKRVVNHPNDQLWNVAVFMAVAPNRAHATTPCVGNAQWCRPCCEEIALLRRFSASGSQSTPEPQVPSFEDLVRAIVASEVEQALNERGGAS
ncbi:MAG: hypothetical protein IT454_19170 [Planctomycetes bacterium]|nr:hypothetical protein [Planctomycetota bacterium]